jgi:hypothetical protein
MNPQTDKDQQQTTASTKISLEVEIQAEKILCPHCRRTATNGIKCKGICVADSDY